MIQCYKIDIIVYLSRDTQMCVILPSSDVQDTVCYLHEPTLRHFQLFITQNHWADFYKIHVIDALQSHYLTKESAQQFLKYVVPKVTQISSYFSSLQHFLICLKTTLPYFKFCQICTINYVI